MDVLEQRAKNSLPAKIFFHVNALNPPEISIPPIAPFTSDEQLAGDLAVEFGKEISSFCRIIQQCRDACAHARRFESSAFSFLRDASVEIRDDGGVGWPGLSDFDLDA